MEAPRGFQHLSMRENAMSRPIGISTSSARRKEGWERRPPRWRAVAIQKHQQQQQRVLPPSTSTSPGIHARREENCREAVGRAGAADTRQVYEEGGAGRRDYMRAGGVQAQSRRTPHPEHRGCHGAPDAIEKHDGIALEEGQAGREGQGVSLWQQRQKQRIEKHRLRAGATSCRKNVAGEKLMT